MDQRLLAIEGQSAEPDRAAGFPAIPTAGKTASCFWSLARFSDWPARLMSRECALGILVIKGISRRIRLQSAETGGKNIFRIAVEAADKAGIGDRMVCVGMILGWTRTDAFELDDPDSDFSKTLVVSELDIGASHRALLSVE
jgi:hypothetical protein